MTERARLDEVRQPQCGVVKKADLQIRRFRFGVVLSGLMIGFMSLVMGCGGSGKTETLTEPTLVSTPEEESGSDAAQRAAIKAQAAENQNQSPY